MVAENDHRRIVGFLLADCVKACGHIITVDVLRGYRGRGLGRKLMLRCHQRLRQLNARVIRLETAVSNRRARSLYQSLGYTCLERARRYYADGQDAWVMEKKLE